MMTSSSHLTTAMMSQSLQGNKMYFFDFESYTKAVEAAKSFTTVVVTVDGRVHASSVIPAVAYASVLEAIASLHELKTAWMQWDRGSAMSPATNPPSLVVVPYSRIDSVKIVFNS